jgi:chaperonin GroEL
MEHKHLLFRSEAREKILHGAKALADTLRVTLGPKSRSVLIGKKWGVPLVCDDGVTIAKELSLEDPEEDLGVRMIRQAAEKTGELVGDGTTTSTILAYAIFAEGLRNIAAGASAVDLRRGLDRGLELAVESLGRQAQPVVGRLQMAQVATISAHGLSDIGELVADAVERVGSEGVITVEEGKSMETLLEIVEGLQFDRGYASPYFATNPEDMECVLEVPLILFHDGKLVVMRDLVPILERTAESARSIVLIAESIEGDALATLIVNKVRGTLKTVAVKAPGFGDHRRAMLEDMAILTGGTVVSAELGMKLESLEQSHLGRAERVVVDQDTTTIIGGAGDKSAIEGRVQQLRKQIEDTSSDYDREKLEERLAKMTGGVAVIRVGARTESAMKSRKEAFDDAINSTKAAMAEGVLPGAGLALLRSIDAVEKEEENSQGDVKTGLSILRRALETPTRQIAENSGLDAGVVVTKMREKQAQGQPIGIDASTGEYVNLVEAGIVDAAKVVRMALENAVSVAGILLLTEATMTELPETEHHPAGPPAGF